MTSLNKSGVPFDKQMSTEIHCDEHSRYNNLHKNVDHFHTFETNILYALEDVTFKDTVYSYEDYKKDAVECGYFKKIPFINFINCNRMLRRFIHRHSDVIRGIKIKHLYTRASIVRDD